MAQLDPQRVEDEFKRLETRIAVNDKLLSRANIRLTLLEDALAKSIKGEPITRESLAAGLAEEDEEGEDPNSKQAKLEREILKEFADQLGLA